MFDLEIAKGAVKTYHLKFDGDAGWRLPRNQKPPLVIRYPLQMFRQDFRLESLLRCRDSQRELQRRE